MTDETKQVSCKTPQIHAIIEPLQNQKEYTSEFKRSKRNQKTIQPEQRQHQPHLWMLCQCGEGNRNNHRYACRPDGTGGRRNVPENPEEGNLRQPRQEPAGTAFFHCAGRKQ